MHFFRFLLAALLTVLISAPDAPVVGRTAAWPLRIDPLVSPAALNSAQPQLTVSSRGVLLSWVERVGDRALLKFADRTATGWSRPKTVASGTDWFVNWADVPSVLRLADGTLAGHWLQKSGAETYAYDVRLAYSTDDGETWSAPFTPHHDGTKTEHGFASLIQMPGAGLGLIWLDGRAMQQSEPQRGHGSHGSGAMSVRFATFDRAWRQTVDVAIDTRVCECCPTTAALTSEGPIAAFRNRSDDEVRDIYVTRLVDGKWTAGAPVHADSWRIDACPVNGPMLSARGRQVAIAWFTVQQDQGHAFAAFSRDAGQTFGAPIRLDDGGALGRVDIELLADGSAIATWIETGPGGTQFRARRVEPSAQVSDAITVADVQATRASGYPRVAVHRDELVFAWTDTDAGSSSRSPRVHTAFGRLP